MEGGGERFFSSSQTSSSNPRNLGFTNKEMSTDMIQKPASAPILDRFRALLREREDELLREFDEEDDDNDVDAGVGVVSGDDIVRIYEAVLGELTFNSKPIITELTIIAGEQREFAEGIAHVICARIVEVAADQKLPSLYLLDSIVKNIGAEYIKYFSSRLPEVFVEAYRQVQPNQHPAMRHLFGTWADVFPSSVLRKIGVELQFSSQLSGPSSLRSSESPSPRPTHGIHVNPKYLEARRRYEHASMNEVHDSRGISSSLQRYGQSSSIGHGEYDMDDPEITSQQVGISKLGSPGISARTSMTGAQRCATNYVHFRPSSPSRVRFPESIPAPDDGYIIDNSPRRTVQKASPSHCGFEYATGRLNNKNGEWNDGLKKTAANNTHPLLETKLKSEFDRQGPRALIDAYGNYRGESISNGKPQNLERIDVNGISSDKATKRWQNTEEEEYMWEDMSPTPADRSRSNDLMPSHHSLQSSNRAGFDRRPIGSVLEPEYRAGYWPPQPQLPVGDDTSGFSERGIPIKRSGHRDAVAKFIGDPGDRNNAAQIQGSRYSREPWNLHPHFSQSSQQYREVGARADQVPFPSSVTALSVGQRNSSMMEDTEGFRSKPSASLVEKHFGQRPHSPPMAPQRWSQTNGFPLPTPPQQHQIRDQSANLVAHRPLINQGAHEASNLPHQQFDSFERKIGNSLLQLPNQLPGPSYLNNQSQGLVAPIQPQVLNSMARGNHVTQNPAQNPSPLHPQHFNRGHSLQGHGTVPSAMPLNRIPGVPPLPMYGTPNTPFQVQGSTRPPLPPGPPPPSLQMGPSSQSVVPVASQPPFNDLINSLMAQGMIQLTTPVSVQDSIGVEFNADILKLRHESSIKALYADLPRQCKTCGLRFKHQEEHSAHMDWHVTRNRVSRNRKQKSSRKWFVSTSLWLSGAESVGNDAIPGFLPNESVVEKKDDELMAVPADENQSACALCGEPFDDFYSDETEEWMYKGAVYLNAPNGSTPGMDRSQLGPIVHAKCRSESTVGPNDDFGQNGGGRIEEDGNQPKRIRV